MSDSHDNQQDVETEVEGVDTDPDDSKKSIEVDTNERLENKDRALDDVPEDELHQERDARLDPDNRPENTEVDNSDRTFNPETGLFEDSDVEPPEGAPFATTDAEQSNQDSGDGDAGSQDDGESGGKHAAR